MRHQFLKRTAVIVLVSFISLIFFQNDVIGTSNQTIINDLEKGKQFYEEGEYDRAIEFLNNFINGNNEKLKAQMCEAYYYLARIYFAGEKKEDMDKAIKGIFKIDIHYPFNQEKNDDFMRRANELRSEIEWKITNQIQKESPGKLKKKKFPWLWVAGGVVVVAVLAILLTKKKPQYKLTVTIDEGVEGTPASGVHTFKKGTTLTYEYLLKSGYSNLSVKIDDAVASASGTILMNRDHTISVISSKTYSLTVFRGTGVNGSPGSCTASYTDGESVTYGYTAQTGYGALIVTIDDQIVSNSGTIVMNKDHSLKAIATQYFTLAVVKGEGVIGLPEDGTSQCKEGETIQYSYYLENGYKNLVVRLDGASIPSSGSITMDKSHTLTVSADTIVKYTLTVTKGAGVDGIPEHGTYTYDEGSTAVYNYSLKSNYKNLTVKLDGVKVDAGGSIDMNSNHSLVVSAEAL